jgi:superfamily II DNA/RNA helicase
VERQIPHSTLKSWLSLFQVLVLAPTRELANQVSKDFSDITKKLSVACFYGGTPYGGQSKCIQKLGGGGLLSGFLSCLLFKDGEEWVPR